jgi:hypothetical protein
MTQNRLIWNFLRWAIFLFVVLEVSSKIEHRLTVKTGSDLSPFFAQTIAGMEKATDDYRATHKEEMRQVGHQMLVARWMVHGMTAIILAGLIVWLRKDTQGMPNTSLEPTAVTPSVPPSRAESRVGGGSVLGR